MYSYFIQYLKRRSRWASGSREPLSGQIYH